VVGRVLRGIVRRRGGFRKRIVAATVVAAAGRKPLDSTPGDIIHVDPTIAYRIQRFPAWLTLGGKTYEVDIIKKSNGAITWDVEVISDCVQGMSSLIQDTVLYWAARNPVGHSYKSDNINVE
jgi:hypothetical protein